MSSIVIDVSANIAKFKAGMDKAALEGKALNKRLGSAFNGISKAMRGIGALAGVAVGGGIATLGKRAIDAADDIQKLGIRTGATAEFLSEMRFALSQSGVSTNEFETALKKLNKSTQDGLDGLSTTTRAFDKLGINLESFAELDTDTKFIAISEAISRIEDPSVRGKVSMDLLGRSGTSLLTVMQDGADGIAQYREQAVLLGQSLSQDQVDSAAAANDALDKLSKSISGGFSQSIIQYTGEIQRAADFTREYLPRAIEFLIDIFRGLKAVIQTVVVTILNQFEALFKAAAKMPIVGEQFKGVAKFFQEASDVIQVQLDQNIEKMGGWRKQGEGVAKEAKSIADRLNSSTIPALKVIGKASTTSAKEIKKVKDNLAKATKEALRLAKATGTDLFRSQKELNRVLDEADLYTENYAKALAQTEAVLTGSRGLVKGTKEYQKALEAAGFATEEIEKATTKSVTTMRDHWERFKDSSYDALQTFWRDGLDGTKSFGDSMKGLFKDMIANILAQITSLIASNAFKKLIGFITNKPSSGGLFDGLGDLFGGGQSSGTGQGGGGSILSSIGSLFGGNTSSAGPVQPGSVAGLFGPTGTIGSLFAQGGFFGSGGTVATTFSQLAGSLGPALSAAAPVLAVIANAAIGRAIADGTGKTGRLLGTVGGIGGGIYARILDGLGIIGNARTPQQLGEDQLAEVDRATRAGLNTQVQLGNAGSTSLSSLGGVDDNSYFFGVDLAREQLQQVGDAFRELTGANQALALRDGILRIEDFNRGFSSNHELIIDQLKASIVKVELSFGDAEKSIVSSLGGSITEFDRLVDSTANSTLTASERIIGAYSRTYDASIAESQKWLDNSGISAERYVEIFSNASDRVLTELVGVTDQATNSALEIGSALGQGFQGFQDHALDSFSVVEGGMYSLTGVALEQSRRIASTYNATPTLTTVQGNTASKQTESESQLVIELRALVDAQRDANNNAEFSRAANAGR